MFGTIHTETVVLIGISPTAAVSVCITAIGTHFMILIGDGKLGLEVSTDLFVLGHAQAGVHTGELDGAWDGITIHGLMALTHIGITVGARDSTITTEDLMLGDGFMVMLVQTVSHFNTVTELLFHLSLV